jgi:NADH:ubiquinone oxidoreductase subunit C
MLESLNLKDNYIISLVFIMNSIFSMLLNICVVNNILLMDLNRYYFIKVLRLLKFSNLRFLVLTDLVGVDFFYKKNSFVLFYNFLSIFLNLRCFIKLNVDVFLLVNSIFKFFKASG